MRPRSHSARCDRRWRLKPTIRGPISRAVKESIKLITPPTLRRNAFHAVRRHVVFGGAQEPDAAVMSELRSRLKPEVIALGEYLQRDLVRLWGYDSVD